MIAPRLVMAIAFPVGGAWWLVSVTDDTQRELQAHAARAGAIVRADTSFTGARGRYAAYSVRLHSTTSLSVTGQLLAPSRRASNVRYPAVLLENGRELNSHAIRHLPADFGDVVVLSLDYPEELPYEIKIRQLLVPGGKLTSAARRVPATFILGARYLASRADVDSTRIAIVASSFAVPFATIAAAAEPRFRNVALIYGAGDMEGVLAANLRIRPAFLRWPVAWLAMRPFAEFAPERFAMHIAPRPLLMINGVDDPQMPRAAVSALYDAAREPKSLVWLRTGHLMPGDTALIRALADTAFNRLPILRADQR